MEIKDIENKIINADCMEFMQNIPDKSIDCIICDLPYGTTACSWDVVIPFNKLWEQYKRIRKDNTPIVLFGSEPFSTFLRMSNIKEYKYDWIWDKITATGMAIAKYQPMKQHEIISVFCEGKCNYFPIMLERTFYKKYRCEKRSNSSPLAYNDGLYRLSDKKYPKSILAFSNANHQEHIHPTQKPIRLIEYLIKTYSNKGDLILDNCSGSGTTAVACHNLKRRFICIEKDKEYYDASVERLKNAQAQLKLF